ncbi:filaggrin-like isoform X3 [Littorina saxatilis]|uniref:filaggrin-like isoform X3 n=1 Tax=Littorina saxatilis TaxID=31220 RepID=UPI0038B5C861
MPKPRGRSASDAGTDGPVTVGTFETLRDEGEHFVHVQQFQRAIDSFTKALEMKAGDKTCLVTRSKCHLMLGNSAAALADAEVALEHEEVGKGKDIRALNMKAEALYQKGDFESALVYFHQGNKLRPELQEFRLGIQKSQEAINNSIGKPDSVKLDASGDLSFFYRHDEKQKQQQKSTYSKPSQPVQKKQEEKSRLKPQDDGTSKTTKQLLGELYNDREFLEKLYDKHSMRAMCHKIGNKMGLTTSGGKEEAGNTDRYIKNRTVDGLEYLTRRADFWRQQKPMYARARDRRRQQKQQQSAQSHGGEQDPMQYILQRLEEIDEAQANGKYEVSLHKCQKTLDKVELWGADRIKNKPALVANLYSCMGNAHLEMGKFKHALEYHNKDLSIGQNDGIEEAESRALDNLGRTKARMGKYDDAIVLWEKKLPRSKSALESTWLFHEIGRCHLELGQNNEAKDFGEKSLAAAQEADDRGWQLHATVLIAQAEVKCQELQAAADSFDRALEIAEELKDSSAQTAIKKALEEVNNRIVQGVQDGGEEDDPMDGGRKSSASNLSNNSQKKAGTRVRWSGSTTSNARGRDYDKDHKKEFYMEEIEGHVPGVQLESDYRTASRDNSAFVPWDDVSRNSSCRQRSNRGLVTKLDLTRNCHDPESSPSSKPPSRSHRPAGRGGAHYSPGTVEPSGSDRPAGRRGIHHSPDTVESSGSDRPASRAGAHYSPDILEPSGSDRPAGRRGIHYYPVTSEPSGCERPQSVGHYSQDTQQTRSESYKCPGQNPNSSRKPQYESDRSESRGFEHFLYDTPQPISESYTFPGQNPNSSRKLQFGFNRPESRDFEHFSYDTPQPRSESHTFPGQNPNSSRKLQFGFNRPESRGFEHFSYDTPQPRSESYKFPAQNPYPSRIPKWRPDSSNSAGNRRDSKEDSEPDSDLNKTLGSRHTTSGGHQRPHTAQTFTLYSNPSLKTAKIAFQQRATKEPVGVAGILPNSTAAKCSGLPLDTSNGSVSKQVTAHSETASQADERSRQQGKLVVKPQCYDFFSRSKTRIPCANSGKEPKTPPSKASQYKPSRYVRPHTAKCPKASSVKVSRPQTAKDSTIQEKDSNFIVINLTKLYDFDGQPHKPPKDLNERKKSAKSPSKKPSSAHLAKTRRSTGDPAQRTHVQTGVRYAEQQTGARYAEQQTGARYADQQTGARYAEQQTGARYADQQTGDRYTEQQTGARYAEQKTGARCAEQKTGARYAEQKTGARCTEQQSAKGADAPPAGVAADLASSPERLIPPHPPRPHCARPHTSPVNTNEFPKGFFDESGSDEEGQFTVYRPLDDTDDDDLHRFFDLSRSNSSAKTREARPEQRRHSNYSGSTTPNESLHNVLTHSESDGIFLQDRQDRLNDHSRTTFLSDSRITRWVYNARPPNSPPTHDHDSFEDMRYTYNSPSERPVRLLSPDFSDSIEEIRLLQLHGRAPDGAGVSTQAAASGSSRPENQREEVSRDQLQSPHYNQGEVVNEDIDWQLVLPDCAQANRNNSGGNTPRKPQRNEHNVGEGRLHRTCHSASGTSDRLHIRSASCSSIYQRAAAGIEKKADAAKEQRAAAAIQKKRALAVMSQRPVSALEQAARVYGHPRRLSSPYKVKLSNRGRLESSRPWTAGSDIDNSSTCDQSGCQLRNKSSCEHSQTILTSRSCKSGQRVSCFQLFSACPELNISKSLPTPAACSELNNSQPFTSPAASSELNNSQSSPSVLNPDNSFSEAKPLLKPHPPSAPPSHPHQDRHVKVSSAPCPIQHKTTGACRVGVKTADSRRARSLSAVAAECYAREQLKARKRQASKRWRTADRFAGNVFI